MAEMGSTAAWQRRAPFRYSKSPRPSATSGRQICSLVLGEDRGKVNVASPHGELSIANYDLGPFGSADGQLDLGMSDTQLRGG